MASAEGDPGEREVGSQDLVANVKDEGVHARVVEWRARPQPRLIDDLVPEEGWVDLENSSDILTQNFLLEYIITHMMSRSRLAVADMAMTKDRDQRFLLIGMGPDSLEKLHSSPAKTPKKSAQEKSRTSTAHLVSSLNLFTVLPA